MKAPKDLSGLSNISGGFRRSLLLVVLLLSCYSYAQESSQAGDLNTNKVGTVDSNNSTVSTSTLYQGAGAASDIPVSGAYAPSMHSGGTDSCLKSISGGISTLQVGFSKGDYVQDEECNRRKDSEALIAAGLKVAGISRLCQNPETWLAMLVSGTPCPLLHKSKTIVGRNAYLMMKKYPELYVPDYESRKEFFDSLLGIGENGENGEEIQAADGAQSISERYRSVKW